MSNNAPEERLKAYLKELGIEGNAYSPVNEEHEFLIVKLAQALEDGTIPQAIQKDGVLSTAYDFVEADPETYDDEVNNIIWLMIMFLGQMKKLHSNQPEMVANRINYDIFQRAVLTLLRLQCMCSIYEHALQAEDPS